MLKMISACSHCFKKIAKKNTMAARMWLDLCDNFQFICICRQDNKIIKSLEKQGFIVTTEYNKINCEISLNGVDMDENVVCIHPEEHY